MKLLASITIVISIPTIVASFFGMNTWVPWEGTVTGFYVAMAIGVWIFSHNRHNTLEKKDVLIGIGIFIF